VTSASDWQLDEFEELLARPDLEDGELSGHLLHVRSSGAIAVVRAGVHTYHADGPDAAKSMLSLMMQDRLQRGPLDFVCQVCGETLS
jgi:hypothetical protein